MEETLDRRREADEKRRGQLRGFFRHLAVFIAVNVGLLALNLLTSPATSGSSG